MTSLNVNWFVELPLDFEHKKYQLLAYLQQINGHFHKNRLYPDLSDLIFHYNNLIKFKKDKSGLQEMFPARLTHADTEALRLTYERMISDDGLMLEIERIISYSLKKMDPALREGKEIYDFVESCISVEAIGVVPLYPYSGYLLLRNGDEKGTKVYRYQITIFEGKDEKYRGVHTNYITHYSSHFLYGTPESIRKDLIHTRRELPNPAVYQIESDITFPLEQTLLPLAKRRLAKYIATAS